MFGDGPACGERGEKASQFNIARIYFTKRLTQLIKPFKFFFLNRNQMLKTLKTRSLCLKSKLLVMVDTTAQSCHWALECSLPATTREMHLWRDLKNNLRTYKHGFISCPTWQAWWSVTTLKLGNFNYDSIQWVTSIMTAYSLQLHTVRRLRWKHVRVQAEQSILKL